MNQIHEGDWAEEEWLSHSGMYEPVGWESAESSVKDVSLMKEDDQEIEKAEL